MKRLLFSVVLCLAAAGMFAAPARAANVGVWSGGGWTLRLTFSHAAYGQIMFGTFASGQRHFAVHGDWIPAGDAGGYLLRFYGHPFGPQSGVGLVGEATLYNTCQPNCAAGRKFELKEVLISPQLPGVNRPTLILTVH